VPDPVADLLARAARGQPPRDDGRTEVLPQPPGPVAAVLAFAGHHVVAADVDAGWVRERLPDGDLSAPVGPAFVAALAHRLGRTFDNLDVVLAAPGLGTAPPLDLRPVPPQRHGDHPRLSRARRYRTEVRAFETPDGAGLVVAGRGLAGRWEIAFEVAPAARGAGLGRALVAAGRSLVPAGEPLFVQVAPGNVPSLRAVLAAGGFTPIGGEILLARPG
jgi:GNAT superfamily N-acetyltransferase